MQTGAPVGMPMAAAGAQSRSEDEEPTGKKDLKRTTTQAFGGGIPKRRSSSRFDCLQFHMHCTNKNIILDKQDISTDWMTGCFYGDLLLHEYIPISPLGQLRGRSLTMSWWKVAL